MKPMFKKFLIKALLLILLAYASLMTYQAYVKPMAEPVRIIQQHEQIKDSKEYIVITKEMVMSKLKQKAQIVSLEQTIENDYTKVDENWVGERETKLHVEGSYKMGLETEDIKVTNIDFDTGIIHIELPEPILISLDIPYDQITFDKTSGWLRMSMSDEEEKRFYKSVVKDIKNKLTTDEQILKQGNLYNQEVVRELVLKLVPGINSVVFE